MIGIGVFLVSLLALLIWVNVRPQKAWREMTPAERKESDDEEQVW